MKIGKNFQDSLTNRGSGGRQIILTSALRSDESIKSLRRRNTNASENSAHRYGTTFDIAYNRYNVTDSTYSTLRRDKSNDNRTIDRPFVKNYYLCHNEDTMRFGIAKSETRFSFVSALTFPYL